MRGRSNHWWYLAFIIKPLVSLKVLIIIITRSLSSVNGYLQVQGIPTFYTSFHLCLKNVINCFCT